MRRWSAWQRVPRRACRSIDGIVMVGCSTHDVDEQPHRVIVQLDDDDDDPGPDSRLLPARPADHQRSADTAIAFERPSVRTFLTRVAPPLVIVLSLVALKVCGWI